MSLSENIVEIDQSFVLIDGNDADKESFFETVENFVLERMRRQEEQLEQERNERHQSQTDIVVETKVINVNKTSKQNNQAFCWGTFISDSGNIEKRTFVN